MAFLFRKNAVISSSHNTWFQLHRI